MKKINNKTKTGLAIIAITLFSALMTPIAFQQAIKNDPDLQKKIEEKYNVRIELGGGSWSVRDSEGNSPEQSWSFPATAQAIQILGKRVDYRVNPAPGNEILIRAHGKAKKKGTLLNLKEENGVISGADTEDVKSLTVEIQIPVSFKGSLELSSIRGDIEVNNVPATKIKFNAVKGDVDLKEVSISEIHGSTINGDIEISSQVEFNGAISTIKGDIEITPVSVKNTEFQISATKGDIENSRPQSVPTNPQFKVVITTINGDIKIK